MTWNWDSEDTETHFLHDIAWLDVTGASYSLVRRYQRAFDWHDRFRRSWERKTIVLDDMFLSLFFEQSGISYS